MMLPCEQQGMDPTACERVQELEALLRRTVSVVIAQRRVTALPSDKVALNMLLADIEAAL